MRRLFVPRARLGGGRAALEPAEAHHLVSVLRLAPGAALEVFDGEGGVHPARLVLDAAGAPAVELGPRRDAPPPGARVHLAFALARGDRPDLVVQKATEVGVERLLPFEAERSVVRLEPERAAERARRWQRIAAEAARQCGRADVPEVAAPARLADVLAAPAGFRTLLCYEGGGEPLAGAVERGGAGHLVVVGPEGGFTSREVEAALAAGARPVTLGPRILRFETAAIVAAALVQHLAGDLG